MLMLDAKGDTALGDELVVPVVCRTADDLLRRIRCVVAGEGFDTLQATARTVTFAAVAAYWDALLAARRRPSALPLRALACDTTVVWLPGWAEKWQQRLALVAAIWTLPRPDTE